MHASDRSAIRWPIWSIGRVRSLTAGLRIANRRLTAAILIVMALAFPTHCDAQESLAEQEQAAFKAAAAAISPSMIQLQTFGGLDRVGEIRTGIGPTTAVALTADGYLISSAFNFVAGPAAVLARLPDGRQLDAKIIATDNTRMLTLLKVEANDLRPPQAIGTEQLRVGQWTLALGKAFSPTIPNMSAGVLSAKDRMWGKALQTDAKISPFNYGGPLIDLHGQALGIIVPLSMNDNETVAGADWYDSGIGFAVPMDQVFASFEKLKAGQDLGRGTLGISLKEGANILAVPEISVIGKGSPAEQVGLQPGDVVIQADSRPVHYLADLQRALGPHYAGDQFPLTVRRGDREVNVNATLARPATGDEAGAAGGEQPKPEAIPGAMPAGPEQPAAPRQNAPLEAPRPE